MPLRGSSYFVGKQEISITRLVATRSAARARQNQPRSPRRAITQTYLWLHWRGIDRYPALFKLALSGAIFTGCVLRYTVVLSGESISCLRNYGCYKRVSCAGSRGASLVLITEDSGASLPHANLRASTRLRVSSPSMYLSVTALTQTRSFTSKVCIGKPRFVELHWVFPVHLRARREAKVDWKIIQSSWVFRAVYAWLYKRAFTWTQKSNDLQPVTSMWRMVKEKKHAIIIVVIIFGAMDRKESNFIPS